MIFNWEEYDKSLNKRLYKRNFALEDKAHRKLKVIVLKELVKMRKEMLKEGYQLWYSLSWIRHKKRD